MYLEFVAILLLGVGVIGSLCLALRWLQNHTADHAQTRAWWGMLLGFWAVFFGLRLCTASGLVSWAPYLDQWKADIYEIVFRLDRNELHWTDLLAPHNEHRILLTRLVTLGLLPVNGEWDNRALVVVSLAIQAAAFAWFGICACQALTRWRSAGVMTLLVVVASLSCDWENFVSGLQSQFHMLVLGTLLVLSILPTAHIRSRSAWGALSLALVLLATLGSGGLTALAAASAIAAAAVMRRDFTWRTAIPFGLCLALFALGIATNAHFTAHDFLHAKSVQEWTGAFIAYASWPLAPRWWGLALLWLPWCALLVQMWRRRDSSPFALLLFSLGLWMLWQAMALAWSRAGLLPLVSSRYTGMLMWTGLVNAAALFWVLPLRESRLRRLWSVLACCGIVMLAGTSVWRSQTVYRPMALSFRSETMRHEAHFRDFMRTDDAMHIEAYTMPEIPYPVPSDLVTWMRNPGVRAILPAPLRRDYAKRVPPPDHETPEAGWLTIIARTLLRHDAAIALILAGGVIAATSWWRLRHRPVEEPEAG